MALIERSHDYFVKAKTQGLSQHIYRDRSCVSSPTSQSSFDGTAESIVGLEKD